MPPTSLALVLNDQAGALLAGGDSTDRLRQRLEAAEIEIHDMAPGDLPARMKQAVASGAGAVVVAGGDGTVACASQMLAGGKIVLGILPSGTMNLLAKDLRLPVGDVDAAADVLIAGEVRRIDVGQVGEHVFACACMLGAPARIGHHREMGRQSGNGVLAWLRVARAAWRAARRGRSLRLILRIDGRAMRVRTNSLTITVNALDDAAGRAFGRTVLDGGHLCAYVVRHRSLLDLLRLAGRLAGGAVKDRALQRLDGKRIEVVRANAESLRVLVDGEERLLSPPLVFEIRPGALAVIAPAA